MNCHLFAEGDLYDNLMQQVDSVLAAFEKEMKAQGLWDSVSLLTISDFGRTLTSNGAARVYPSDDIFVHFGSRVAFFV